MFPLKYFKGVSLCFVIILFLSVVVQGTITANNIRCADPGYLSFVAMYGCSKNCSRYPKLNFSYVDISAKSPFGTYRISVENPPDFMEEKKYNFVSKGELLDHHGGYTLTLYDGEHKKSYNVICPNEKYLCERIDLAIDLCMKDDYNFYYLFHGLYNQFSEDELRDEIDYYINPSNTYIGTFSIKSKEMGERPMKSENIPESFTVMPVGQDRYVLKVPIRDLHDKEMKSVYMEILGCDKAIYKTAALKKCEDRECVSDGHCPIGSYCENGICKILNCGDCEEIEDHKCVSSCRSKKPCEIGICKNGECNYVKKEECCLKDEDCKDNLTCTEDVCIDTNCIHKGLVCNSSDDPCVSGKCDEKKGCIYTSDPNCTKRKASLSPLTNKVQEALMSNAAIVSIRILFLLVLFGLFLKLFKKKKSKKRKA